MKLPNFIQIFKKSIKRDQTIPREKSPLVEARGEQSGQANTAVYPETYKCTRTTKNTYEAAFYALRGAQLISVRTIPVPVNKVDRKGFRDQWIMSLKDIPVNAVAEWQTNKAVANVQAFEAARKTVKSDIKRMLI